MKKFPITLAFDNGKVIGTVIFDEKSVKLIHPNSVLSVGFIANKIEDRKVLDMEIVCFGLIDVKDHPAMHGRLEEID